MDNFEFYSPTFFAFGDGQEKNTGALIRRFGGSKVLMVYGGGSIKRNGAYDDATASLQAAGLPWLELGGVLPNPRSGKIYEGIELCRREGVDFLLAVGGGSAIDTAKAIAAGAVYDGDFWDLYSKQPATASLPVGVVLTLSATGSEGSNSSVITHEEKGVKWGNLKSDVFRPVFSVLNPRYTCSLPAYQTACGAADMLSHIMERYFSPSENVSLTDRIAEGLMKTIIDAAPLALAQPENYHARADLMWAGMLAHNNLCGVGRKHDWSSHQIDHELSAHYDCAHGAALAMVTPAWMEYVMDHNIPRFAQFAVQVFNCNMDFQNPKRTALAGIECLRQWLKELNMPQTLAELGAKEEDIPALIARRRKKANAFPFGGIAPIDEAGMEAILRLADRN